MKTAVVAITSQGAETAARVAAALSDLPEAEVDLLLPARFAAGRAGALPYSRPLAEMCGEWFQHYRRLVMVMALGIVVRLLAPHINDKRRDPAVVVLDEKGRFAISALSGHLGGANDLALYLQEKIGPVAVVTTATDVHGLPAVDLLARDYNLAAEPYECLKAVSAALVNGEPVRFYSEVALEGELPKKLMIRPIKDFLAGLPEGARHVLITNRKMEGAPPGTLFLRPRNLVVGLGCRRGAGAAVVKEAVENALAGAGLSLSSVRLLSTVDIRAGEEGLVQAAKELDLPLVAFTREDIAGIFRLRQEELSFSKFVFNRIGVGGVCEPAALLAAPAARLILRKSAWKGVTVAVAGDACSLSGSAREMPGI